MGELSLSNILVICGLFSHFVLFASMFVKLENRLTTLETTLAFLTKSFGDATFIDRRSK